MAKRGVRARVGWAKQYLGGVFGKTKLNGPGLNGPAVGHPNGINVTTSLDDNNTMADANTTKKKRPFLRRRRDTDSIEGHNNTAHISGPTVAIPASFSRSNGAKNDHAKPKRNFFHRRAQSPAGGVNISSNNLRTDLTISAPILLKQGSTFDKSGSTIFTDSHPLIDDSDKRKLFEKVKKTGEDENCKQSNAGNKISSFLPHSSLFFLFWGVLFPPGLHHFFFEYVKIF